MKVDLEGVSETLLIPFYARVYGSKYYKEKFYDKYALEAFDKIEYNFSKFEKGKMSIWGCLSRSKILDKECKKIIEKYPDITCINIGCGFDTRFNRIDNGKIKWYGIDFSEVINLRNKLFTRKDREDYIKANAVEEDWAKKIQLKGECLIILEGILMYFTEEEVKKLFNILKKYFPNSIILAEFSRPSLIKNQKRHDTISKTTAKLHWGIAKSKDIEILCPGVKYIQEWNLTNEMLKFSRFFMILIYPLIYRVNNVIVKLEFI